jgi:energy-coupling factor transporter ATP-binding protein EcfA2
MLAKGVAMRLVSVTVQLFRNFVAAQTISIERDVTCLLGKNESGKTTLLKALHRLNAANGTDDRFDLTTEYPRWRLAPDRRANPGLVETAPVQAEFALDVADIEALAPLLPVPVPAATLCVATKSYDNELHFNLHAELGAVVDAAANETELTPDDLEAVRGHDTLGAVQSAARSRARELKPDQGTALRATALTRFATALGKAASLVDDGVELSDEAYDALYELLPKFFYFSNYDVLPGESDLTKLAAKLHNEAALTPEEETVVSLLAHAGETPDDFLDGNYDSRKAELQAASSDLSRQAFQYWRQNPDLTVVFDTDNVSVGPDPNGGDLMHRLNLRRPSAGARLWSMSATHPPRPSRRALPTRTRTTASSRRLPSAQPRQTHGPRSPGRPPLRGCAEACVESVAPSAPARRSPGKIHRGVLEIENGLGPRALPRRRDRSCVGGCDGRRSPSRWPDSVARGRPRHRQRQHAGLGLRRRGGLERVRRGVEDVPTEGVPGRARQRRPRAAAPVAIRRRRRP